MAASDDPSLGRAALLRRAVPLMVANLSTPIVGLVDTAVVGRSGGPEGLAAIALGALAFNVLYWLVGFLRMGTTGLAAQAAGSGDATEVGAVLARSVTLAVGFGVVFVVLQAPLQELVFWLFSGAPDVEAAGRAYFGARIWGAPAALVGFCVFGWLVALGHTRAALGLQLVLNALNGGFDVLFVYGFDAGVAGVAAAAALSQWISLGVALVIVRRVLRERGISVGAAFARLDRASLIRVATVNRDIFLRTAALLAGMAWFNEAGLREGTLVAAANAILFQLSTASAYFLDAFANITEAEVGQAVGARSVARLKQAVRRTSELALVCAAVCSLAFYLGGGWAIDALTTDASTRALARTLLPYCALVPLVGFPSWQMDGIMIGATRGPVMRNSMAAALVIYLGLDHVLRPEYGAHGLWWAFLAYYVARFATQAFGYPGLVRDVREAAA